MSRRRQPKKHDRPLHVCSLSMSALKVVEQELENSQKTLDSMAPEDRFKARGLFMELNQLRWIQLCMQYNQHTQLQYIHDQNSDKSSNPKFRQILMRPLFNFWKQEYMRDNWMQLHRAIFDLAAEQRINARADHFQRQRTALSSNRFSRKFDNFDKLTAELLENNQLDAIDAFMLPSSTNLKLFNQDRNYCSSDAIEMWSDEEEEEEEEYNENKEETNKDENAAENEADEDNQKKEEEEKAEAKEREVEIDEDDEPIDTKEDDKEDKEPEEPIQAEAVQEKEEPIKEQTEKKKKSFSPLILIILALLITVVIVAALLYFRSKQPLAQEEYVDLTETTKGVVYEDDCEE